jgi:hypothetical protein
LAPAIPSLVTKPKKEDRKVAARLVNCVRISDTIARLETFRSTF